jgi:UDP-N-acetylmuramate--alanine ligase
MDRNSQPLDARPYLAHLVGIAGAGMKALADVLLGMGWQLSGSDLAACSTQGLAAAGVRLFQGHAAQHLDARTQLVIFSSAIPPDNPELLRAAELGIPALSYFQMLGRLMQGKQGLAVGGTHGKSTTAAMAAQILVEAGLDPTVVFGAVPLGANSGGRAGGGEILLVEACEYRQNFLHLRPQQAVILGIEPDHFDCYDSLAALESAFARFATAVPPDGLLLVRQGCASSRRATADVACRIETFGPEPGADWSAENPLARRGRYSFDLCYRGRTLGRVQVPIAGRHNAANALAAAALAFHNGATVEQVVASLGRFGGLHRRLEVLGTWQGVTLVDDYAHHPTEVAVSLEAIRGMFPGRRVCCVFQPHQASRTARLLDELATSLENAETVLVAEIFRAREPPPRQGEVTAADLARRVQTRGPEVPSLHSPEEILRFLETHLRPGDVLVSMGAGDIGRIAYGLMERLREDRAAG